MSSNKRSQRQLESLLRIRNWHLNAVLRAHSDGRHGEAQFHMQFYRLLGAAVEGAE